MSATGATLAWKGPLPSMQEALTAPYRYRGDLLRFCLAALIVLSISRIHQRYTFLSILRPGLVLTGVSIAVALLKPQVLADASWTRRWPARLVFCLTVVSISSIAFGISQGGAWWFFSNYYWKVLVTGILLMAAVRNERDLWFFVWAHVVGVAILAFMALFVFQTVAEGNGITRLSNLDTWDANDVCVLMLISLPLCLLLLRTSTAKGKFVAGVVLIAIGAVIARSGSRGGFLGLSAVLFAYLGSMKGQAKVRGIAMVMMVAIGLSLAAPSGYWKQMSTITSVKEDYNWDAAQGRRQLAIRGIGYMMSYPFFGVGIGNFGRAEGTISLIAGQKGVRWSAPHNSFVQAGAELGVPGFVLFLAMILGCIIAPWRLRRRIPDSWESGTWEQRFLSQLAIYLPLSAIGFAAPAYFVSFAYLDPIYMLVAITAGLIAAVERQIRVSPDGNRQSSEGSPRALRGVTPPQRRARPNPPIYWAPAPVELRRSVATSEPATVLLIAGHKASQCSVST